MSMIAPQGGYPEEAVREEKSKHQVEVRKTQTAGRALASVGHQM